MNVDERLPIIIHRIARVVRWTLLVGIVVAPVLVFVGIGKMGVGAFDVRVSIHSASGSPIADARAFATMDEERARAIAANPRSRIRDESNPEQVFDGKSLGVTVWTYSNGYCCDLWTVTSWRRFLVLIVEYSDGKRAGKVVEIPYQAEQIAVDVP